MIRKSGKTSELFPVFRLLIELFFARFGLTGSVVTVYAVYDSGTIERPFAISLDNDPDVKLFFKIPERFKIAPPLEPITPIGGSI